MLTLDEARDWLRVDGTENDAIISALLESTDDYISAATGAGEAEIRAYPITDTIKRLLLTLWYNAEQAEADRLQRTIDGLLKSFAALLDKGL